MTFVTLHHNATQDDDHPLTSDRLNKRFDGTQGGEMADVYVIPEKSKTCHNIQKLRKKTAHARRTKLRAKW